MRPCPRTGQDDDGVKFHSKHGENMSQKLGVCCECQSSHPVRPARGRSRSEFEEGLDDTDDQFGEEGEYVMADHYPFGERACSGSGTTPQAVFDGS